MISYKCCNGSVLDVFQWGDMRSLGMYSLCTHSWLISASFLDLCAAG